MYQQGVKEQGMWVEGEYTGQYRAPIIVLGFIGLAITIMMWTTPSHRFEK